MTRFFTSTACKEPESVYDLVSPTYVSLDQAMFPYLSYYQIILHGNLLPPAVAQHAPRFLASTLCWGFAGMAVAMRAQLMVRTVNNF